MRLEFIKLPINEAVKFECEWNCSCCEVNCLKLVKFSVDGMALPLANMKVCASCSLLVLEYEADQEMEMPNLDCEDCCETKPANEFHDEELCIECSNTRSREEGEPYQDLKTRQENEDTQWDYWKKKYE